MHQMILKGSYEGPTLKFYDNNLKDMLNKVRHIGSGCPGKPRFRMAKTWLASLLVS